MQCKRRWIVQSTMQLNIFTVGNWFSHQLFIHHCHNNGLCSLIGWHHCLLPSQRRDTTSISSSLAQHSFSNSSIWESKTQLYIHTSPFTNSNFTIHYHYSYYITMKIKCYNLISNSGGLKWKFCKQIIWKIRSHFSENFYPKI
jgi:hypothetical protein